MLKTIAIVALVLVAAVLVFAATKPNSFRVARSTTIKAPPEKILAFINDFRRWSWSPYEHRDPAMKRTLTGAPAGKGAVYEWDGNKDIGSGRMEIVEVSPSQTTIQLDFLSPFEAHNVAEFTVEPRGNATGLTWSMRGPSTFMTKLIGVFVSMDSMVGKDFETGLANLKSLAEAA